jgi:hypothetical protein
MPAEDTNWQRFIRTARERFDSPWGSRDDLRRYALHEQRNHDPAQQGDASWPDRCMHCHYTRHPCDVYDLASAVLWLLDEGRTDA